VSVGEVLWSTHFAAQEKFDLILISDCLFFDSFHKGLVHSLKELSHAETRIMILAPFRGQTFNQFVELAKHVFKC